VIDVLEPYDVVLAEIAADLDLDQLQRDLAGIGEAVATSGERSWSSRAPSRMGLFC
jgi:hypothetical protein